MDTGAPARPSVEPGAAPRATAPHDGHAPATVSGRAPRTLRTLWRQPRVRWAAVVAVLVLAVVVWRWPDDGPPPVTSADVGRAVEQGIAEAQKEARNAPPDAAAAYRRISPSLVTIVTGAAAGQAPTAEGGLGAGVIIDAQGAVLTAAHVVDGAGPIQVRFADGTQANARVTTSQPETDIAQLAVDRLPEIVVPAVIGGGADVGDAVFPVGNPLGLQGSLTAGVVSALDRSLPVAAGRTLKGLIQFDAAVNPGNSGGPLLDRNGQVIGVVTGLVNPTRQPFFVGIGFAVPIAAVGDGELAQK